MSFVSYSRRSFSGTAPDTALAAGIDGSTLTVTVVSATGWPDGTGGNFIVTFEPGTSNEEKALGASRSGNTITLAQRALEGSAVAHVASSVVRHGLAAVDVDEANYAVSQTVGKIAAKGDILYGSAANAFTKLAKGTSGQAPTWQSDGSLAAANPVPAAHSHVESDVTALVGDLSTLASGKMSNPVTAWAKGSVLAGTGAATYDATAVGIDGLVLTADSAAAGGVSWKTSPAVALLARVDYDPAGVGIPHVGALTAISTSNATVSFTVPSSGKALIRVGGFIAGYASTTITMGWLNHTGGAQVGRTQTAAAAGNVATVLSVSFSRTQTLTGLTPGATLQLDFAMSSSGASNAGTIADLTIEVWAAA